MYPLKNFMEYDRTNKRSSNTPKHPKYKTYSSRVESFVAWPIRYVPKTPEQLASAGFFYIGSADRVTCFQCGITLRDWEEEHDPVAEHQRYSEHCQFINKVTVDQLGVVKRRNGSLVNTSASCTKAVGDAMVTSETDREEINQVSVSTPKPDGGEIQEANNDLHLGGGACAPPQGMDVPSEAREDDQNARPFSSLCERLGALTVQQCKDGGLSEGDPVPATISSARKQEAQGSKVPTTSQDGKEEPTVAKSPKNNLISIKAENRRLKEQSTCRKCRIKAVSTLFLPCGHLVTCSDCAEEVDACVVCGTTILGTVKTFLI
ncbi:baculoviral IAP repeat-containing protein 3-like isoform X2 [Haliotis rubra]|nr:baculoviral IAP repeat-containing protein 3-like isoform X2 [Haliotis rubra]XP_046545285.1 baculoviral IAP repeat-containing protein 3-like isoform X2 [Haliotis rubra]XP_046545286.1 baculoviral IAP repeat-containing protein 3-like isoform X2 [Haliotis rubra]